MRPLDRARQVVNALTLATPLGLLLARLGRARLRPGPHGVLVASGYRARLPAPHAGAVTVGDVVLLRLDDAQLARLPGLLDHEARHAGQWACWAGLVGFPAAYALATLWSLARGGGGALRNVFEVRAGLVDGGYLQPGEDVEQALARRREQRVRRGSRRRGPR